MHIKPFLLLAFFARVYLISFTIGQTHFRTQSHSSPNIWPKERKTLGARMGRIYLCEDATRTQSSLVLKHEGDGKEGTTERQ